MLRNLSLQAPNSFSICLSIYLSIFPSFFSYFVVVFVFSSFVYLYELTSIRLKSKEEFVERTVNPNLEYQSAGVCVRYSQLYAVNLHYI
jgi:hypothetical protein